MEIEQDQSMKLSVENERGLLYANFIKCNTTRGIYTKSFLIEEAKLLG